MIPLRSYSKRSEAMEEKLLHHYLHNQAIGTVLCQRRDEQTLDCMLPDGETYQLRVDSRQQANLVVFDGQLPFGALPKRAIVLELQNYTGRLHQQLSCRKEAMRKAPDYPCVAAPQYVEVGDMEVIDVWRYFILLPSCMAVVRKFRDDSLSPIYVVIDSSYNQEGKGIVEWRTSSY